MHYSIVISKPPGQNDWKSAIVPKWWDREEALQVRDRCLVNTECLPESFVFVVLDLAALVGALRANNVYWSRNQTGSHSMLLISAESRRL